MCVRVRVCCCGPHPSCLLSSLQKGFTVVAQAWVLLPLPNISFRPEMGMEEKTLAVIAVVGGLMHVRLGLAVSG